MRTTKKFIFPEF